MEVSPYLSAIQSLNGETPGDKYKELHSIAAQIIKNDEEKIEFLSTGTSKRVHPAMYPHLRILVGNKLKMNDAVIEALKSDNVIIIKQALSAKWFFDSSNALIHVDYIVANVVPYISLRTRLELVKTLAHCLMDEPQKANDFFGSFADLYGLDQALPLIVACSEKYIFEVVLERRIILPSRILGVLYCRYPQLVIRYLQLGNDKNEASKEDRKIHKISLSNYIGFLPTLVKNHAQEFVEFYECLPNYYRIVMTKLGNTRSEFFLKNATDALIEKPHKLLKLLPLKLVTNKLTTQQFETMFENLFSIDANEFNVDDMIEYLQYYPREKKFSLLLDKYKLLYGKSLLDNKDIFKSSNFWKLLPLDVKEKCGRKFVDSFAGKLEYYNHVLRLPPRESFPILKERINKPSETLRHQLIEQMICSCSIYESKEDLLLVLLYYNARHKNEQGYALREVLQTLTREFDIKTLDKQHWQVLKEIIQRAYVKGDLFGAPTDTYRPLFKGALHYFLKQCKAGEVEEENKVFLDKLIGIILECYLEYRMKWEFIIDCADIDRDCLQIFLQAIPQKYPESHTIWNKYGNKLNLTSYLIKSMHSFNVRRFYAESKKKHSSCITITDSEGNEIKQTKFMIKDYPWLTKFSADLLKADQTVKDIRDKRIYLQHRNTLRKHDLEFYQKLIDEDPELLNDLETNDALGLLKRDRNKILHKWKLYLTTCREKLQCDCRSAKHFVVTTKWYQDIPVKFVEQCLHEIEEKGSAFVLGILLEGQEFSKIVDPFLPKDKKINVNDEEAKRIYQITASLPKAINFANPPVSFDVVATFCQGDYVSLAAQTLTSVAQRMPTDKVLAFAYQLVDKPISIKKLGIRLVFQVASKIESREFLKRMWNSEKNPSIREVVAKMIFDVFRLSPTAETWELIKVCISGLTGDDQTVLDVLKDVEAIDKNFVALYIQEFLKTIDKFTVSDLDDATKSKFVCSIVAKIDDNILHLLPEELITDILKRQFFKYPSSFICNVYLFSDTDKFEYRLKNFIDIIQDEMKKFEESDPIRLRYYPTRYRIRIFFQGFLQHLLSTEKNDMCLQIMTEALKLFSTVLRPWQEPQTFIALTVYKVYLKTTTPKDFGRKCAVNTSRLVKEFASEIIINDVAKIMNIILKNTNVFNGMKRTDLKLIIIEGLMESDKRLGALLGIKLLSCYEISSYDDRFDSLIKTWREIENSSVQGVLSEFLNEICEGYF